MKRILVSLISGQTIPNIEFIKEMQSEVDQFLFISTLGMEKSGNREWILKTVQIEEDKILPTLIVNQFSFEDIEKKLSKNVSDDNQYVINLTGGTKVMSLAVYEFFKKVTSTMYYLTGQGEYIKMHPVIKKAAYPIRSKISLKEYLTAYGFEVSNESEPFRDRKTCNELLNYFLNSFNKEKDVPVLDTLRQFRSKNLSSLENIQGLDSFLTRINYQPKNENKLSKYECRYLSGDWLEDYLFFFLIDNFNIEEKEIGLSWNVVKNGSPNEFDVLLMRNNKLYLFECKTSIYLDNEESQTFIGETIYKSDSLRNKFGLFSQTTVFTLSDLENPRLKKHIERAEASKVKLIGRKDFTTERLIKALEKI